MSSVHNDRLGANQHLDSLGFQNSFLPNSLNLIEKLDNEILFQKSKSPELQRFAPKTEEDNRPGERYDKDITKLVEQNLDLQNSLQEVHDKWNSAQNLLQSQVKSLEEEVDDFKFINSHYLKKIAKLEEEIALKNANIYELTATKPVIRSAPWKKQQIFDPLLANGRRCMDASISEENVGIIKVMEKRNTSLTKQMEALRLDNCKLSDVVLALRRQIRVKDAEIARQKKSSEEKKTAVLREECCCRCQEKDVFIHNLEQQLQNAVDKQHEAMTRAVSLAERNAGLEQELNQLRRIAAELEENNKLSESRQKEIETMEERLSKSSEEIKVLDERLKETRERVDVESKTAEKLRMEKRRLEQDLGSVNSDKKKLNERINQFVVEEKEMKEEIERLRAANQVLHRRFAEKDSKYSVCNELACRSNTCPCKCPRKFPNDPPWKSKRLKDKTEPKICGCAPAILYLDKIQQERDMYHQECHMLREQVCNNLPCRSNQGREFDARGASQEESLKLHLDRVERERDIALADLRRVQEERDSLRERFKHCGPQYNHNSDLERMLSDVVSQQGVNRSSLSLLERQCEDYRAQLRTCQAELTQVNTLYSQLKALHDQTDRSFTGTQGRLIQLETELTHAQSKVRELEKSRWEMEEKITQINREKIVLTQNLATVEKDKDDLVMNLDEKTERLVRIETELKRRDSQVAEGNGRLSQMEKKFELMLSEKTTRDHAFRTLEQTLERVRLDLEQVSKEAEVLRAENRRLKDDLSSALRDGQSAHQEVETCRQEVLNLKRQLQQYVAEVEKAEELIAQKEKEQALMLNNFHTLSVEANSLENSNHTLETEVVASKTAVEDLTRQLHELETQINSKDSVINEYERQISSLRCSTSELQARFDAEARLRYQAEQEASALKCLCKTMETQKENIRVQVESVDVDRASLSQEVRRLSEEVNGLHDTLNRERSENSELRDSLNHSRQETMKHEMSSKELTALIRRLERSVEELKDQLIVESSNVRRYQEQCCDLSKEVTELRRERTNARYNSALAPNSDDGGYSCESTHLAYEEITISSRDVPPLPMPDSSDVSSVSSDFYLSPDGNGTYRVLTETSPSWSDHFSIPQRQLSDIIENSLSFDGSCEGVRDSRSVTNCEYYGSFWK